MQQQRHGRWRGQFATGKNNRVMPMSREAACVGLLAAGVAAGWRRTGPSASVTSSVAGRLNQDKGKLVFAATYCTRRNV